MTTEQKPNFETKSASVTIDATLQEIVSHLVAARQGRGYDLDLPLAILPQGLTPTSLEKLMPRPMRVRKSLHFTEMGSFLAYYEKFNKGYTPQLFVRDLNTGMDVLCVFDYDKPYVPAETVETDGTETSELPEEALVPSWGDHTAKLSLTYHPDYQTLRGKDGSWFSQEDFALFIEENTRLFLSPSGADMLELAQEIKGIQNAEWTQGKRLSNGATKIGYNEVVSASGAKGEMEVPAHLIFNVPLFEGEQAQKVTAAFRWRFSDRKITFSYRLLTKQLERDQKKLVRDHITGFTKILPLAVQSFDGVKV